MAKPSTYSERQRVVTSEETWNSSAMPVAPDEMPPAHQQLAFVRKITQYGSGDVREDVKHTDKEGNVPFSQVAPVPGIIAVVMGECYTDWQSFLGGVPGPSQGLLFREDHRQILAVGIFNFLKSGIEANLAFT
jgi:hypothetical protein